MDRIVRLVASVAEVTPATRWIFVELTTAAGRRGAGEASLNNQDAAVLAELRALAPQVFALPHAGPAEFRVPRDLPQAAALSAVDQALWDLAAQAAGTSVAQALGGAIRDRIPLYANINRRTRDRSPDGHAASARDALAAGFTAVKIAPFDEVAPPPAARRPGSLANGLARIAATRAAIGPDHQLLVDCHWRFDQAEAEQVLRETAAQDLYWLECPLPETADNLAALRHLRGLANARGTRLAGLELAIGLQGFEPFLQAGAYDAMMPDAKYVGGLKEMQRVAERFAEAGVAFSPHNPTGPICHAASLQICAAVPTADRLEVQFDETPNFDALVGGRSPAAQGGAQGGASPLPDGPGLGLALDAAALARLRIDGFELTSPNG